MEKKEAKIKCTGCGSSFKVKVPVTDKPVNFKCKNCGKVLKLKVSGSSAPGPEAAAPPPAPAPPPPGPGPEDLDEGYAPDFADEVNPATGEGNLPGFDTGRFAEETDSAEGPPIPELEGTGFADDGGSSPGFETTQLPGEDAPGVVPEAPAIAVGTSPAYGGESPGSYADATPGSYAEPTPGGYANTPAGVEDSGSHVLKKWMVMVDENVVNGPFEDSEIKDMIKRGDIGSRTPVRLGERPWVKAGEIAVFRDLFAAKGKHGAHKALDTIRLLDEDEAEEEAGPPFYTDLPNVLPYPLGQGNFKPLGVLAAIAFVLSALLCFNVTIGLPVNIIGWILLFAYLSTVAQESKRAPSAPPPDWDFAVIKESASEGAKTFVVLLLMSLIPTGICFLLMLFFFLNSIPALGYLFILLTMAVFLGSLFFVPAALYILTASKDIGTALKPGKIIATIRKGGKSYTMFAGITLGVGFAAMAATILAIFLTEIPLAGFLVAAVLMAVVFSYGHLLWFHVTGRFTKENKAITEQVLFRA
jgi:predicted RNA-binding Zn-ribbon protein involved in translation (DUF1610 family)